VAAVGVSVVAPEEPLDTQARYVEASGLASRGQHVEARRLYARLEGLLTSADGESRLRALVQNDLAVMAAMDGRFDEARAAWQTALEIDRECLVARLNRDLTEAEINRGQATEGFGELKLAPAPMPSPLAGEGGPEGRMRGRVSHGGSPPHPPFGHPLPGRGEGEDSSSGAVRAAIISLLFNWPSTGGGNHHTAELAHFLGRAGYEVKHFFARYPGWGIGRVTDALISPSEAIAFDDASWNVGEIQARYRAAVDAFAPDYVIITDSWNMKPLLAEAVRGYPYYLLYQAQENICPLNNLRLLATGPNQVEQCPRNQLATPEICCRCLAERGPHSGALHKFERELAGVGSQEYYAKLRRALSEAEAVMVLNPVIEAMLQPYSSRVRVVPWGMDAARFPWPPRDEPHAGVDGSAGEAGAGGRPAVGFEGGVKRPAPSAEEGRPAVGLEGGVERPAPSAEEGRPAVGLEGGGQETRAQRKRGRETRARRKRGREATSGTFRAWIARSGVSRPVRTWPCWPTTWATWLRQSGNGARWCTRCLGIGKDGAAWARPYCVAAGSRRQNRLRKRC
jgi:tetratricopeptide (TPR) repeat protein